MTERNPYHPDGLWPTAGSYTRTDEDWKARAEKAEQERDHLATVLATTARQRDEADKRNAHPLSPDAITDEMVERARRSLEDDGWIVPEDGVGQLADALTAALTESPARPEGAEELARLIADADVEEWDCGDLADALLATGRVRVTGSES